jgi:hypothetical protein
MFYLAEFYRNSKQYRSAIEWYQKRIDRGGWQEETWYARYMIGAATKRWGNFPRPRLLIWMPIPIVPPVPSLSTI